MQIELNEQGLPATFNPEGFDRFRGDGTERIGYGDGKGPYVLFKPKSVHMGAASLSAGKPVFKSVLFVRIQHPGERDFIERPATPADVEAHPRQYQHYLAGRKGTPDGIPTAVLFPNHEDIVSMLAFHSVHTVEQLAELTDTQKQNIGMGGYEWSQKAQRYLAALAEGKGFAQHEDKIQRLETEGRRKDEAIVSLTQQVQQLTNNIALLMANPQMLQQQQMGAAPGMAALPPAPAQFVAPQGGGFMQPAPGELGADDNVEVPSGPAAGNAAPPPDGFLDQVAAAAAPETATRRRR